MGRYRRGDDWSPPQTDRARPRLRRAAWQTRQLPEQADHARQQEDGRADCAGAERNQRIGLGQGKPAAGNIFLVQKRSQGCHAQWETRLTSVDRVLAGWREHEVMAGSVYMITCIGDGIGVRLSVRTRLGNG